MGGTELLTVRQTLPDDIERHAFKRFMEKLGIDLSEEPRLPFERDLLIRAVLAKRGEEMNATFYGLLAFGKDPQDHPQTRSFWVECVAYDGLDRADDVLVSGEGRGRINEQVDRAMGWFRGLPRQERYDNIRREDRPVVPEAALREAVVNAVCHRDYAIVGSRILVEVFKDRVAVTSPGALPNHMTPESVRAGGHPRSRNELLANFMQTLGYMEGRGRGWPRIRRAMLAHNAREPLLSENRDGRWVRVTLPIVVE
jgi:ATP-dependent DNA helicase RecG